MDLAKILRGVKANQGFHNPGGRGRLSLSLAPGRTYRTFLLEHWKSGDSIDLAWLSRLAVEPYSFLGLAGMETQQGEAVGALGGAPPVADKAVTGATFDGGKPTLSDLVAKLNFHAAVDDREADTKRIRDLTHGEEILNALDLERGFSHD
jgi:hypothetical protein